MKRLLLSILVIVFVTTVCQNKAERKPNVIIVVVDKLGWKDVGFMGSKFYETPNSDKIATNAMDEILNILDEYDLTENTIITFTSDNGGVYYCFG